MVLAAGLACGPAAAQQKEAAPAREALPFKRDADAFDAGMLLRTAAALGLVIAIGFAGVYALKRFVPSSLGRASGGPGRINVLEIRRVTPRLTLLLVEVDGEKVFLAQSGDRVRTLRLPGRETAQ